MKLLHNIGETDNPLAQSNYNTREEIIFSESHLSFDGVYKNVWENRDILKGEKCLLFVMGNYIGGDNSFDKGMPPERFCTWKEITDLINDGHILGWHTWNHPDLTELTLEEARIEMTPPFRMNDFAYPYGEFNEDLMKLAEDLGYERAWSVTQGNDNNYSLRREYL